MVVSYDKLLTMIPIYGAILKHSQKGEIIICSQMHSDLSEEGIDAAEIYRLLEEKYPGEVVTSDRFAEGYRTMKVKMNKK